MKKRLLLVLLVGLSFAPSVFADGVGPVVKSADLDSQGGSACAANAAQEKTVFDSIVNGNPVQQIGKSKSSGAR